MTTDKFWLGYDLGLKGDYPSLFKWLDERESIECGNNLAFVTFNYEVNLYEELLKSLNETINFNSTDRIYLITTADNIPHKSIPNGKEKFPNGRFIIGGRKAAPWTGYAQKKSPTDTPDG